MNRSLTNVLFGGTAPVAAPSEYKIEGQITQTGADDVVEALENADNVILVCSLCRPFCCNLTCGTGRWIRHGRGKGAICGIRNHTLIAGKGCERTVRDPPRRRTHARPVQRPARRSIGTL